MTIKIDDDLKIRVLNLAETKNRSAQWIICEALRDYVEREEKQERFHQEATESWNEFQETGLHVTWEELSAWLETVGTDAETEPPECHT
jgi:predicted transcriptional regulator